MKYYFIHPENINDTPKQRVLEDLIKLCPYFSNPIITNPNHHYHQFFIKKEGFKYTLELIEQSDCFVFLSNDNGIIDSKICKEIILAKNLNKRIFEIDPITFQINEHRGKDILKRVCEGIEITEIFPEVLKPKKKKIRVEIEYPFHLSLTVKKINDAIVSTFNGYDFSNTKVIELPKTNFKEKRISD